MKRRNQNVTLCFFFVLFFCFFFCGFFFFVRLFFFFCFFFLQVTMCHQKLNNRRDVEEKKEGLRIQLSLVGTVPTCDKTRYQYVIFESQQNLTRRKSREMIRKPIAPALIPIDVICPTVYWLLKIELVKPRPVVYRETRTLV